MSLSTQIKRMPSGRFLSWASLILGVWYVLLCALHLLYQRPLWNDELCVLESIKKFSTQEMFSSPLLAFQVFPRVYLFIIQQISGVFDYNLFILRLPSFVGMMTAFFLWVKFSKKIFEDNWSHLSFVASWVASGMLLYYSAELKQYSMDVLAGILFLLFLYAQGHETDDILRDSKKWSRFVLAAAFLPVLVLFSYPAYFFVPLVIYNFIFLVKKNQHYRLPFSLYIGSLIVFVFLSYFFDVRLREINVLTDAWKDYFVSTASVEQFFQTFGEGVNNLFSRWFVEYPKYFKSLTRCFVGFGLIYLFYGFFKNIRRERYLLKSLETIAFVLFIEMFVAGMLYKYPFTVPRTSLFFCPIVFYLTIRGIYQTYFIHRYFYRLVQGLYFLFLAFLIIMQTRVGWAGQLSYMPRLW